MIRSAAAIGSVNLLAVIFFMIMLYFFNHEFLRAPQMNFSSNLLSKCIAFIVSDQFFYSDLVISSTFQLHE